MKLPEICQSKKAQAAMVIIVIAILKDNGIVSEACAKEMSIALMTYIGAQSIADHGKERAKIEEGKPEA